RRHTRSTRDWSSDVCSSDLDDDDTSPLALADDTEPVLIPASSAPGAGPTRLTVHVELALDPDVSANQIVSFANETAQLRAELRRSEERRVGKEWRSRVAR